MSSVSQEKMPWLVLKFGGTSVSSLEKWQSIAKIAQARVDQGFRVLIVCSAASQISNQLEKLIASLIAGEQGDHLEKIKHRYRDLADQLGIDDNTVLSENFANLSQLVEGISLLKEASPRVHAQVMAFGELMLTRLGVAYLAQAGLSVAWRDARECLQTLSDPVANEATQYLAARCLHEYDEDLATAFAQAAEPILMTQGFIAHNDRGETVLLGRGGSDVSAAYFAAKLAAARCEIWTDVPGIYTANPQQIPEARYLRFLDYDEAQEIASMGGKVLHPNCIGPMKRASIPLHVKFTQDPDREGTVVSNQSDDSGVQIKSILTKSGILIFSIETVRMWHQVGFLGDVFQCFKKQGVSIDLISTSESSVTVSLDRSVALSGAGVIDKLLEDLNQFARAKVIGPCASISLVGHNIRAILHKLGGVFEVFESQQIHLLSQAANDLNLTFVVDEDQVGRIAKKLHTVLIDQNPRSQYLSKTWQEEFGQHIKRSTPWWETQRETLLEMAKNTSPLYAYNQSSIDDAAEQLLSCDTVEHVFYAMKANSHPNILRRIHVKGLNFECVSPNEVNSILELFPDIDRKRILFTPNFAAREEYEQAIAQGVYLTVDSLYPLQHWPEIFVGKDILIRVDPGHGAGHHKFVITGGDASKFGIPLAYLDQVHALAEKHNINIVGLHVHSGSGILQPDNWRGSAELLLTLLAQFPDVHILNLGGGLGIVERPGQRALDVTALNESLKDIKSQHPKLALWLEPGRFLVAQSGVILAKVTQTKLKGDSYFVGIETGMNSLIRPALYGAYHEIVNLTRFEDPKRVMTNIVGPICESGDTLGYSRLLPETQEGDVLLIANTGAYGRVMSSYYNQREPAQEYYFD